MRGVECLSQLPSGYFRAAALCREHDPQRSVRAYGAPRQRIALGWQAKPMLEQTAASPLALRVQLTHSSVQRLQFGGPV